MRQKFVRCETVDEALNECPWASATLEVCEGYICYESWDDYNTAINQR